MDLISLAFRVVVGGLIAGHGTQKLLGWFDGPGLDGAAKFMDSLGYHPARTAAVAASLTETIGGGLLLVGLLTPLGAAMVVGAMVNAVAANAPRGIWASNRGYELPLLYAVSAVAIAATGPGQLSVDALFGAATWGGVWAILAGLFGLTMGIVVNGSRRHTAETVS